MKILEITTKIGCKVACSYCPQGKLTKAYRFISSEREMNLNNFRTLLASVPLDVDIHFSGYGEPFHAVDAVEMIQYADIKGHKVAVYTTCDNLKKEDIDLLAHIKFKDFVVHVQDSNKSMKLVELNRLNYIYKYLYKSNINKLKYLCLGVPNEEIDQQIKNITIASPIIHSRANNLYYSDDNVKQLINQDQLVLRFNNKKVKCRKNRMYANVLLPNGNLQICCMDYSLENKIGNLFEDKYEDIHKKEEFKVFLDSMLDENSDLICKKCEYARKI